VASFYIENFGCRAAQADGAALAGQFLARGLRAAEAAQKAQIVVLNTCTVTEGADKDARASIRRLQRENPGCRILVTGCYAQRAPEEIAALPGVTWVIGNSHKHLAAQIVTEEAVSEQVENQTPSRLIQISSGTHEGIFVGDIFAHTELLAAPVFDASNERTRPNLKVQDGCDNRCSFCVIPFVRGQSRSMPMDRVLAEVRSLVESGYREVVISGINLGRWGRDLDLGSQLVASWPQCPRFYFENLVRVILDETLLEKLRISSVEPMDWSDELIGLMASSSRIAKHAHAPMQSGSDSVLRRMHRKYRPWHYREKIHKIRDAMPDAAIGADVMVGFPGETDHEFAETRRMVEELPFTYLHVFTYSARPGTPAASRNDHVPVGLARERNQVLREIAAAKKTAFMKAQVGKTVAAITLGTGDRKRADALTDNYLKMTVDYSSLSRADLRPMNVEVASDLQPNRWIKAQVERVDGDVLEARLA
jgi:threonylcarbamoyladenosine tRNA methylthiotransferase MtaB